MIAPTTGRVNFTNDDAEAAVGIYERIIISRNFYFQEVLYQAGVGVIKAPPS